MYEYAHNARRPRKTANRPLRRVPESWTSRAATVVTMLEPTLRTSIDGATDDAFTKVHVTSVSEAFAAVRLHSARALLLSPSIARHQGLSEIARLVGKSPGVIVIAVLGDDWTSAHQSLLDLGACGVRHVVNLAERGGWNQLRALVDSAGGHATAVIVKSILSSLEDATDESRHFFATLVHLAPTIGNVKTLASAFGVESSTLMSRFFRASLPAPKAYLSMTRLLYAASYFETPRVSIPDVAYRLNYSSPQSFGRHVRMLLGLTAGEYRREYTLTTALDHYTQRLILPHQEMFRVFRPIGSGSILGSVHTRESARELRFAEGA
jgi:AraC-like DNA-binding protein